ncbi:hypothetical protein [Streptomyces sp. NPDC058475]|uniref:hypothetical protein n=1 Tax=Streptomyces sp. NPDC058475 TaxID=3346518 RepID=UPI0036650E9B
MTVTARGEGLRTATVTVRTTRAAVKASTPVTPFEPDHPAVPNYRYAEASYSGRADTLPAAMLDGDPATRRPAGPTPSTSRRRQPTVITFEAVRGSRLRLVMASGHPGAADGGLRISRLEVPAG